MLGNEKYTFNIISIINLATCHIKVAPLSPWLDNDSDRLNRTIISAQGGTEIVESHSLRE